VTALAARRRHPLATVVLVLLGLLGMGVLYALAVPGRAAATQAAYSPDDVAAGKNLFLANCSTCHNINGTGRRNAPSLVGVGAASVDFQVSSGRMPLQASGPQAPASRDPRYTPEQIRQMAAYVASLGPGPEIPSAEAVDPAKGNPARGGELFRTNCAMCHNFAANGGALTRGKYAPNLNNSTPTQIYEAMVIGPQAMPVFSDTNIDPEAKRDIIAWVRTIKTAPQPGGLSLGGIGPVSEGLVGWVVGLAALIGCAVWLGAKSS
jgi:ubiquinol-cytochrome c reductase cytochrome c subunit